MKINKLMAVVGGALLLPFITSCEKQGVALYEGYYSYKTSGSVEVERTLIESSEKSEETLSVVSENGQMNILKNGDNKLIITMNAIGGDVVVLDAEVVDKELVISEFSRMVKIEDGSRTVSLNCKVSGSGKKYDNVIILDLNYSGSGSSTIYSYNIKSSSVKCVAKVNEQ
ncbi:MAG: hypothetical protein ACI4TL_00660 [Candidatus Cryptobacteroides sp.]